MQLFHVISVFVPLVIILGLPRLLKLGGFKDKNNRWLLVLACLLFFISWYLPSPLIDGKDTSFMTHLVGGGIFSGLVWWYLVRTLRIKVSIAVEVISLFTLVSTLGALNELLELFLVRAGIASILLTDTSWDILANTVGALAVFVVYLLVKARR